MGITKSAAFTTQQNSLAAMAKAIAHPARIAILEVLLQSDTCICGDIVDQLPLSQSTISQHLKALKSAGLIQGTISGPSTCYCIDQKAWQAAQAAMNGFFDRLEGQADCC